MSFYKLQAGKIQVQLADERTFEARLVGADSDSDLAVLKINGTTCVPHLPLGSADDLMIGETFMPSTITSAYRTPSQPG